MSSYDAPKAPPVRNSIYDPYQPYGQANATWRPPVFNRDRTIVKPKRTVISGCAARLRERTLGDGRRWQHAVRDVLAEADGAGDATK